MVRKPQRIRYGSWVLAACALHIVAPAQGRDRDPVAAFRRAVSIHRNLQCGDHFIQGLSVRYAVEPRRSQSAREVRERMIEVLRRRAEGWGREGPSIASRGEDQVEVWYPGPPQRVAAMRMVLERPGVLAFHAVETRSPWLDALGPAVDRWSEAHPDGTVTLERPYDDTVVRGDTLAELDAFGATLPELPPDRIVAFAEEDVLDQGSERRARWRLYLLHADAPVHGGHIASAGVTTDEHDGMPRISLEFTAAGAAAFADLTEALTQRYLAIVLDGRVMSAPKVMERITGGRAQITLGSGRPYPEIFEEARSLATVLGSGGHPGMLNVVSEDPGGQAPAEGWRALGPLPFTAQALALLITFRYGCF
ncbi:MAG: hypothetical protein ABIK09_17905 [Pseudomonadota bacterium]